MSYKLHPELQKEIDKMNHAETIMKSTFDDELKQIRRHRKSCCNRKRSHIPDAISEVLTGIALISIVTAWIGIVIWAAYSILNK